MIRTHRSLLSPRVLATSTFLGLAACALVPVPGLAQSSPASGADSKVISDLSAAVGAMRYVTGLDRVPVLQRDLERASQRVAACKTALTAAHDAGVSDSTEFDVADNRDFPGARSVRRDRGFGLVGKVGDVGPYCDGIGQRVGQARIGVFVNHAHGRINRLRSRTTKNPDLIRDVRRAGDLCQRKVRAALGDGVPATTVIALGSDQVTLGAADAQVCQVALDDAGRATRELLADQAEELAPVRRQLGGDRWRAYADNMLLGAELYVGTGEQRERVSEPAELAKASLWFEVHDDSLLDSEWVIRRYQFSDDHLVSVRSIHGRGSAPEPSQFQ